MIAPHLPATDLEVKSEVESTTAGEKGPLLIRIVAMICSIRGRRSRAVFFFDSERIALKQSSLDLSEIWRRDLTIFTPSPRDVAAYTAPHVNGAAGHRRPKTHASRRT